MNDSRQVPDLIDWQVFHANQQNHTVEQLAPYEGRHVAWSLDGTRILASGEDMGEVCRNLVTAGFDPSRVVFGYIDPPDVVRL